MRSIVQKDRTAAKGLGRGEDISIESVFGLWKNRDVGKEALREKAWKKNWIA